MLTCAAVAALPCAAVGAAAPATAAKPKNLIVDPAIAQRHRGVPRCYGLATIARGKVRFSALPRGDGDVLTLTAGPVAALISQSPACAPRVVVGHPYVASLQYRARPGTIASLQVLRHTRAGWSPWYVARTSLKPRTAFGKVAVLLRPIQGNVDRIAFGLLVRGRGRVGTTRFSLVDASRTPSAAATPAITSTTTPAPASPPAETPADPVVPTDPSHAGQWTVRPAPAPVRSVHAILLQNGKVLLMAGSGNDASAFAAGTFKSYLYDPVADTFELIETPKDVFCSGHVQLANGNVLVIGGTAAYPDPPAPGQPPSTAYKGQNAAWIFDIHTNTYTPVTRHGLAGPPLLSGAWYPSATELGNGDVIAFGGIDETGAGRTKTDYFTDPANPGTNGDLPGEFVGFGSGKLQQTFPWYWGEYPSMILAADGRLFFSGSHVFGGGIEGSEQAPSGSSLYNFLCNPNADREYVAQHPGTDVAFRVQDTPGLRDTDHRDQSASLLLPPAQDQKVMILGGGDTYTTLAGTDKSAINLTDVIDLDAPNPHWAPGPDLPRGRMDDGSMQTMGTGKMYVSAVALPDGTVLETGGSQHTRADNVHEASIFDPATSTFAPVAPDPVGRNYHSEALLLPDGRVLALGSNPLDGSFEMRVSIYKPPYLFKGARPVLTTLDGQANSVRQDGTNLTTQWSYGSSHVLGFTSSSTIRSAVLIRPAAVTHSSDPNQRELALPISAHGDGELTVDLTSNSNLAPPGYYMVFLVNSEGVPSVAQWVHIGPQGAPAP